MARPSQSMRELSLKEYAQQALAIYGGNYDLNEVNRKLGELKFRLSLKDLEIVKTQAPINRSNALGEVKAMEKALKWFRKRAGENTGESQGEFEGDGRK